MSALTKFDPPKLARIGKIVDDLELWGPDLRKLPSLAEQLARLETALPDPHRYAEEWVAVQAQLASGSEDGLGATLMWMNDDADDAQPRLYNGYVACDDQERERSERSQALSAHLPEAAEYRDAIRDWLFYRGHYADNRRTPRDRIFQIVRGALAVGGRIMINPDGKVECGGGWPANRNVKRTAAEDAAAHQAMQALAHILRRHRDRPTMERIVRLAGKPFNNWIVLEARS